jgi:hypothetical protein
MAPVCALWQPMQHASLPACIMLSPSSTVANDAQYRILRGGNSPGERGWLQSETEDLGVHYTSSPCSRLVSIEGSGFPAELQWGFGIYSFLVCHQLPCQWVRTFGATVVHGIRFGLAADYRACRGCSMPAIAGMLHLQVFSRQVCTGGDAAHTSQVTAASPACASCGLSGQGCTGGAATCMHRSHQHQAALAGCWEAGRHTASRKDRLGCGHRQTRLQSATWHTASHWQFGCSRKHKS